MLDGDVEGVEKFLKANSNYGPLFCAYERIKKELNKINVIKGICEATNPGEENANVLNTNITKIYRECCHS